jgi:hypothetical protein
MFISYTDMPGPVEVTAEAGFFIRIVISAVVAEKCNLGLACHVFLVMNVFFWYLNLRRQMDSVQTR